MASEREFQRKLIQFFEDKLGYEEKNSNLAYQGLIIKDDLRRFLQSSKNAAEFSSLVKESFSGSTSDAVDAIADFIIKEHFSRPIHIEANSATFLQTQTFRFLGREFWLFYPSPSPQSINRFSENIFSIAEELKYKPVIDYPVDNVISRRPDLVFYVNGIYFSLLELKHIFKGSNAESGKVKIIGDYNAYVVNYFPTQLKSSSHSQDEIQARNRVLSLYEKAVHVASMDHKTLSLMRDIRRYRKECQENGKFGSKQIEPVINKTFFDYPLRHNEDKGAVDLGLVGRYEDVLRDIYGKRAIENEILFYNYRERVTGSQHRHLISPRPKQKYGADRTMERVRWLYKHESDEAFIRNEYAARLRRLGVPDSRIEDEINTRMKLVNDTGCYSILKQYAAGFGKTKLMSWEAAQLIQMHNQDGSGYLFDKVVLVSDRLDLRDQMGQTLGSMPILDASIWEVASDTQEFMSSLGSDTCRIIAVNIQKFLALERQLSEAEKATLASMRVAFVIDEIHRSNDGKQNDNMMDLFEGLTAVNGRKKNLIIGLTATAKDKTLQRYGEISGYTSHGMIFEPFDNFTMQEAIDAGFVLNPMDTFFPVHQPIIIDETFVDEDRIGLDYRKPSSEDFYTSDEKIRGVVKKSMEYLRAVTFKRIMKPGTGSIAKAMYVAYNIDAALLAFKFFREEIDTLYEDEQTKPGLYIVYSKSAKSDQRSRPTSNSLNNGMSEESAIKAFKADNNAIIIVVDKLQTGFDEPTLHTLILNTERKDVTMVQTLCRVNRTHKYKTECLVLDFSVIRPDGLKTRNEVNATDAFMKYAGINTSALSLVAEEDLIGKRFKQLHEHYVYQKLYDSYIKACYDIDHEPVFYDDLNKIDEDLIKEYFEIAREMFGSIKKLRGIVHLDKNLIKKIEKSKIDLFLKSLRKMLTSNKETVPSLPFEVLDISGVTVEDVERLMDEDKKAHKTSGRKKKSDKEGGAPKNKHSVLEAIKKHNEMNEYSEERILEFISYTQMFLATLMGQPTSGRLNNRIKDDPTGEHVQEFVKELKSLSRRVKGLRGTQKSRIVIMEGMTPERNKEYMSKLITILGVFSGSLYQEYVDLVMKSS